MMRDSVLSLVVLVCWAAVPASAQSEPPCEAQRFVPPVLTEFGDFGNIVQMNEDHLIVADWRDGALAVPVGSYLHGGVHAYRFDADAGRWEFTQSIYPADIAPGHLFGSSLDFDGDRLIVGSIGSDLGGSNAGAAYVFDFDGTRWVETGAILPIEPAVSSEFGLRVAVHGIWAAVTQQGHVAHMYEETGEGWEFRQTLDTRAEPRGALATGLAVHEDWLVVGVPNESTEVIQGGAAYVYQRDADGVYVLRDVLRPRETPDTIQMWYGMAIDMDSDRLVVGAPVDWAGAFYVYLRQAEGWSLEQRVPYVGPAIFITYLGESVDLHGDTIATGAPSRNHSRPAPATPTAATPTASGGKSCVRWPRRVRKGSGRARRPTACTPPSLGAVHVFDLSCTICRPDLDHDGALTIFDFLTFLNAFAAGDPLADFDGDGDLTLFDFLAFQTAFAVGCG